MLAQKFAVKRYRRSLALGVIALAVTAPKVASADDWQVHALGAGGHALGGDQQREFGIGVLGGLALEYTPVPVLGFQLGVDGFVLSKADSPENVRLADHDAGTAADVTLGVRLHPMAATKVAGLWLDANGGVAFTGTLTRAVFDTHIGYDWRLGGQESRSRWDLGPFVGYTQIFQPDDTLRPDDARVLWVGAHLAFGASPLQAGDRDGDTILDPEDACPDVPGVRTDDPKTNGCPRGDRDNDGIFDDEDACPDVPGIRTSDPKTNGCPRGDRDKDTVFDDEDACPDVPGIRTADPKTNGCPRPDRDKDTVFDDEDACPDVPGIRTDDPKTNGCPKPVDTVHVEGDQILSDMIHFDFNIAAVKRSSWPVVQKVAQFITQTGEITEIEINGHADEIGTPEYNVKLSDGRAQAVKALLVKFGVDPAKLKTHAYGKSEPLVEGHDDAARAENRRVQFTIKRTSASGAPTTETTTLPGPTDTATPTPVPAPAPASATPPSSAKPPADKTDKTDKTDKKAPAPAPKTP